MLTIVYPNMMWLGHFISNTGAFEKRKFVTWLQTDNTLYFQSCYFNGKLKNTITVRHNSFQNQWMMWGNANYLHVLQVFPFPQCEFVVCVPDYRWLWPCGDVAAPGQGMMVMHGTVEFALGSSARQCFYSTPFIKSKNSVGLRRNMYNQLTLSCHFILVEA